MRSVSPSRRLLVVAGLLLLPAAAAAHLHVRLEAADPAPDAVLAASPDRLQLRFSGRVEQRYTRLALTGPDGRAVPLGSVVFADGSDREFSATVPPLAEPGVYTVHWRTAGADGHVLEGSYAFRLESVRDPVPAAADPPADSALAPVAHDHGAGHGEGPVSSSTRPLNVMGRGLHFAALLLLLGAIAFRTLLLTRVTLDDDVARDMRRRAWRTAAFAALLLVAAALLRLWLQSVELHGSDRAWSPPLLSMMLTGTTWGRAWVVQAVLLGFIAAALAAARPHRDRTALIIAVPAAIGLAAIPALSGHAAGAQGNAVLVVLNDTAHVAAGGAWLGTLALVMVAALPAMSKQDVGAQRDVAHLIARFSPLALAAAAVLLLTGVVNAILHFPAVDAVFGTDYGRTFLVKLALVAGLLAAGAFNWRVVRPRLDDDHGTARLRRSVAIELGFAAAVLTVTAVLTGLARPY